MDAISSASGGTRTRWVLMLGVAGAVAQASLCAGCGDRQGGTDHPGIQIRPVEPVTFVFHNGCDAPLYVDWSHDRARLHILRDGAEVAIAPACGASACEQGCGCNPCLEPPPKVFKVSAGEDLRVKWDAVRYEHEACGEGGACECARAWPATVARYVARVQGAMGVLGGSATPGDGRILEGATLDPASKSVEVTAKFELRGGETVTAAFVCP